MKAVFTILSPLEHATHVHVTLNCETEMLDVHLPQLKLDFFLRKGATELELKQFHEMAVDANQLIDTLTELINKLILRRGDNSLCSVIIPHSNILFKSEGPHVCVHIDTLTQHLLYHLYHVDCQMG